MNKLTITTIIFLLTTCLCYSWEYQRFEGELVLIDEPIKETFDQEGEYLLFEYEGFHPVDYALNRYKDGSEDKDTYFYTRAGYDYNRRHGVDIIFKITIFQQPRLQITENIEPDYRSLTWKPNVNSDDEINLSHKNHFDSPSPVYSSEKPHCLKRIKVYADVQYIHPDYPPPSVKIEYLRIENLIIANPEYENLCEFSLDTNMNYKLEDNIDIVIDGNFYFGYDLPSVDVYIVFYNGFDLYFYPSMTTTVEMVNLFIPQYTMSKRTEFNIGSYPLTNLNPVIGENYMTIGVAPEGTLDFLNEVYVRKFTVE